MSDDADLTLREVLDVLDGLYPPHTAESWDRVGLVPATRSRPCGASTSPSTRPWRSSPRHVQLGADLLLTHHPLLLRGVHSIATTSAKGAAVTDLVVGDVALYVAHTNADVAEQGVGTALAQACGLTSTEPLALAEGHPLGRVGDLEDAVSLRSFVERLASRLPVGAGGIARRRTAGCRGASRRAARGLG